MSRALLHRPSLGTYPDLAAANGMSNLVETGSAKSDERLHGGLVRAALHEVFAGVEADDCTGFALLLAMRALVTKPVLWVREDRSERWRGRLYAPGLIELGANPGSVLLVKTPDTVSLLRAGADIVNCSAVDAVILEPWGTAPVFDLTASRRLALAAARSGVMVLVARAGVDPMPSAAQTRWRVSPAPSEPLDGNAPGLPTFDISLLRHRGGIAGFDGRVEWDRDRKAFRDAPLHGGVPAFVIGGTGAPPMRRAA